MGDADREGILALSDACFTEHIPGVRKEMIFRVLNDRVYSSTSYHIICYIYILNENIYIYIYRMFYSLAVDPSVKCVKKLCSCRQQRAFDWL